MEADAWHDYDEVMARAKAALTGLIRRRDAAGIAALRSVISELDNACAVPVDESPTADTVEVGLSEAPRRGLSAADVERILDCEMAMRQEQAQALSAAGRDLEASIAGYQATLVRRLRDGDGA